MSFELNDYIFFDDEFNIIQASGLYDDDAADSRCTQLMREHNKTISCYRLISIYDPETTPRADELRIGADDAGQDGADKYCPHCDHTPCLGQFDASDA